MKARSTASTIFILFLFGALSALAQSHPPRHKPSGPYTFEVNAEEVVLNCTVLDSKGQLVNGLDKSNFKVAEDGIQQTIISIQHQDSPGLHWPARRQLWIHAPQARRHRLRRPRPRQSL